MTSIFQGIDVFFLASLEPLPLGTHTGCSDAERAQAVHRVLIVGEPKRFRRLIDPC